MNYLDWILLFVSVLLIALVMLQESKDDVKNTFSGEKSELFKNQKQRGPELFLTRMTLGMTVVFGVVTILALILPR
jgi:preprotein translocase subunit SecG